MADRVSDECGEGVEVAVDDKQDIDHDHLQLEPTDQPLDFARKGSHFMSIYCNLENLRGRKTFAVFVATHGQAAKLFSEAKAYIL